jgi:hypothetical protein
VPLTPAFFDPFERRGVGSDEEPRIFSAEHDVAWIVGLDHLAFSEGTAERDVGEPW